jgi:hypothetical protein
MQKAKLLIILQLFAVLSLQGALVLTNASFESFTDDTTTSGSNNHDLITDWFEENHGTDGSSTGDDTTEQVLIEGGNRPLTTAGEYWGHLTDNTGISDLPAIYQSLGTWNTGDPTQYTLTALLGDRDNRPFGALTFKFLTGDATATSPADGVKYADAYANIVTLAQDETVTLDGGAGTLTQAYSNTFDLVGLSDGDEVFLRIVMLESGSEERHSLIDDITITAVPEPSTYAIFAGLMTLGLVLLRRRMRD